MRKKFTRFSKSIIFKSVAFLIVSTMLIVSCGTFIFTTRQMETNLTASFESSEFQLQQVVAMVENEMEDFAKQQALLAKTSEIQGMDPIVAADYIKSYNIASLYTSGETVSLFNNKDSLICDNSMLGTSNAHYPTIDFSKITPRRPYVSPWYRGTDNTPKKAFATAVLNQAASNGSLVASFSIRRLWTSLNNFKVGKKGYVVAFNSNAEILFHPDLKKWMNGIHKISEIGLEEFNVKTFEIKEPTFITLNNGKQFLINYSFRPNFDIGFITLLPKSEIDEKTASIRHVSLTLLIASIMAIIFVALWLILILARPMNKLIEHIDQITQGNIDVENIDVGKRNDEIGQLSKAFNMMHDTIKRQIKELNAHQEMLEEQVRERTQELEEANKKLDVISRTDELTGLPNRRDIHKTIAREVGRSSRTFKPFCFIFFDIDFFKKVNDTYGHAAGDAVLKMVASTVRTLLRKYDVLARYGGEEFLTLLPETDLEGAVVVAERFRQKIEKTVVKLGDKEIKVTITLGVAAYDEKLGVERSIQQADKALYEGKESGRNKVTVWSKERTSEEDYKQAAMEISPRKNV